MRVHGAQYVLAVAAGAGLAFAGGSQAAGHRQVRCRRGYVRHSVRVPERRHGRIVHRHGRIVYVDVQRCVKVTAKPTPGPTVTPPAATTTAVPAAPPPLPVATVTTTTTATTATVTTTTSTATDTTSATTDTTSSSTTTTTTLPPPPPPYGGTCATPFPGASQTLGGNRYALEGMDTFTKDAAIGSFAQSYVPDATSLPVVYTGDHGMGWTEYPDDWPSTYTKPPNYATPHEGYQPSTVQSVHDGVLDFYLHDDANGYPVGADPSPLPGGNRYQIYGAWSFCEKIAPNQAYSGAGLADFYQAPLLWPDDSGGDSLLWQFAESDFPEGELDNTTHDTFWANAHYGGLGYLDQYSFTLDPNEWHVYTQVWGPGHRAYYVDGQLIATSTSDVYDQPERWQLQVEPAPQTGNSSTGHVYVKWVWIGTAQ